MNFERELKQQREAEELAQAQALEAATSAQEMMAEATEEAEGLSRATEILQQEELPGGGKVSAPAASVAEPKPSDIAQAAMYDKARAAMDEDLRNLQKFQVMNTRRRRDEDYGPDPSVAEQQQKELEEGARELAQMQTGILPWEQGLTRKRTSGLLEQALNAPLPGSGSGLSSLTATPEREASQLDMRSITTPGVNIADLAQVEDIPVEGPSLTGRYNADEGSPERSLTTPSETREPQTDMKSITSAPPTTPVARGELEEDLASVASIATSSTISKTESVKQMQEIPHTTRK